MKVLHDGKFTTSFLNYSNGLTLLRPGREKTNKQQKNKTKQEQKEKKSAHSFKMLLTFKPLSAVQQIDNVQVLKANSHQSVVLCLLRSGSLAHLAQQHILPLYSLLQ